MSNKNRRLPQELPSQGRLRWLRCGSWLSPALALYAAGLLALVVAYHVAMTVVAATWLVLRMPAILLSSLRDEERGEVDGEPARVYQERMRTWLPQLRYRDPDATIGPVLSRDDAPGLFLIVAELAGKLGSPRPDEVRLTYLPCCGVLEQRCWGGLRSRRRVLVVGLPLLYVLTVEELRAVVAHELAHLSRGDAALAFVVSQFLESLQQATGRDQRPLVRRLDPCALLARAAGGVFRVLSSPLSRHQEYRADRLAALVCGSDVVAGSLRKVALVQPVFQEVLTYYHPVVMHASNLYRFFRDTWTALGEGLKEQMQQALVVGETPRLLDPHPSLESRLERINRLPPHPEPDCRPAGRLLAERDRLEQVLHNYLYRSRTPLLSVFHPYR